MGADVDAVARSALVVFALLTATACGGPPPAESQRSDDVKREAADASGRDTDATVFDDMLQTQDRARAVEGVTLGRKDELDRALESAGDEDSSAAP